MSSSSDSIHITYDFYNNDNTSPKTNHSPTAANHAKAKTNNNDYQASSPAPSRLTGEVLYLRVTFLNRRSRMRHFRPCQPFTADNM